MGPTSRSPGRTSSTSTAATGSTTRPAPGLTISGNTIGTDTLHSPGVGNTSNGIELVDASGASVVGNVIANNVSNGILATDDPGLLVRFNFIGTDSPGAVLANRGDGIQVVGDAGPASGISLAVNEVAYSGQAGIAVRGRVDGLSLSSNTIVVNQLDGVLISATPSADGPSASLALNSIEQNGEDGLHLVGARDVQAGQGNVIVSNQTNGVEFAQGSAYNTVAGGTISSNTSDGVRIDTNASSNMISGSTIAGNLGDGVAIVSVMDPTTKVFDVEASNQVAGDTVSGNHNNGILINGEGAGSNTLAYNFIGSALSPNQNSGISLLDAGAGNLASSDVIVNNFVNGISISRGLGGDVVKDNQIGAGPGSGNRNFGLSIDGSDGSDVAGNVIANNLSNGVVVSNLSSGNQLSGNTISSNKLAGILLLNVSGNIVGGQGTGNTIVSNSTDGVELYLSPSNTNFGNFVIDNMIGTDAANAVMLGNMGDGIHLIGSSNNLIEGNVASANLQSGVEIFGNSLTNHVIANVLGTTTGNPLLDNKVDGALISGSNPTNLVAGTDPINNEVTSNEISGNASDGVAINLADGNTVKGNLIGQFGANGLYGVSVASSSNTQITPVYSPTGAQITPGNVIVANLAGGINLVGSPSTLVSGNTVGNNAGNGIGLVQSNGSAILFNMVDSNQADGVAVVSTNGSAITSNVISRSSLDGIGLDGSSYTTIDGDFVENNTSDGIRIEDSSTYNQLGASAANHILANIHGAGVEIGTNSTSNTLLNNQIGFSQHGIVIPNGIGVFLNQVAYNYVGGSSLATANTITGNLAYGVYISQNASTIGGQASGVGDVVQFNYIGTGSDGESPGPLPGFAQQVGILASNSADNVVRANIISGNEAAGVELFGGLSSGNNLYLNTIGSDRYQTTPILTDPTQSVQYYSDEDRQDDGILLNGAPGNDIGYGNTILGNMDGIDVVGSTATDNVIEDSNIGPVNAAPGSDSPIAAGYNKLIGLGNVTGIYISNTGGTALPGPETNPASLGTQILNNAIARNVVTGVSIVGPAAGYNVVQGNVITENGGYSNSAKAPDGLTYTVAPETVGDVIYNGAGVYIESGDEQPGRRGHEWECLGDRRRQQLHHQQHRGRRLHLQLRHPAHDQRHERLQHGRGEHDLRGGFDREPHQRPPRRGVRGAPVQLVGESRRGPPGRRLREQRPRVQLHHRLVPRIHRLHGGAGPDRPRPRLDGQRAERLREVRVAQASRHGEGRREGPPPPAGLQVLVEEVLNPPERPGRSSPDDRRGRVPPRPAEVDVQQDRPLDRERPGARHRDDHAHRQDRILPEPRVEAGGDVDDVGRPELVQGVVRPRVVDRRVHVDLERGGYRRDQRVGLVVPVDVIAHAEVVVEQRRLGGVDRHVEGGEALHVEPIAIEEEGEEGLDRRGVARRQEPGAAELARRGLGADRDAAAGQAPRLPIDREDRCLM